MPKYLFRSNCPICLDGDIIEWIHTDCGGRRYIDEDLYLLCDKCNNRTFILDSGFSCDKHKDSHKPELYDIISLISQITNIPDMNSATRRKMINKLRNMIY